MEHVIQHSEFLLMNPVHNKLQLKREFANVRNKELTILSAEGRIVQSSIIENQELSVIDLSPGLYIATFRYIDESGSIIDLNQKFIKF